MTAQCRMANNLLVQSVVDGKVATGYIYLKLVIRHDVLIIQQ